MRGPPTACLLLSALAMNGQGEGAAAAQTLVPADDAAAPIDRTVHPSGIVPTLQNIVATVNLATKLDLKQIALTARNAEYNPKVCARLPNRTLGIAFTVHYCNFACPISKLNPLRSFQGWVVAALSCALCAFYSHCCVVAGVHGLPWGASQRFAAVIMRIRDPKTTALIFASGKMVSCWQQS